MKLVRELLPLVLVLVLRQNLFLPSALAVPAECGLRDDHHVGSMYDSSAWAVRGAQAYITVREADLCTSEISESSAWSMLFSSDYIGYAQIGYVDKNTGVEHRFFWEWLEGGAGSSGRHTGIWGTPVLNSNYNFKVSRYPADGLVHLLMGTGTAPPYNMEGWPAVTDFDPIDEWPDVVAQFNAETWDRENDIVGSSLTRARFSSVQEKDPSDDWDSYTWTGGF
jgi:hypothetical protein